MSSQPLNGKCGLSVTGIMYAVWGLFFVFVFFEKRFLMVVDE